MGQSLFIVDSLWTLLVGFPLCTQLSIKLSQDAEGVLLPTLEATWEGLNYGKMRMRSTTILSGEASGSPPRFSDIANFMKQLKL